MFLVVLIQPLVSFAVISHLVKVKGMPVIACGEHHDEHKSDPAQVEEACQVLKNVSKPLWIGIEKPAHFKGEKLPNKITAQLCNFSFKHVRVENIENRCIGSLVQHALELNERVRGVLVAAEKEVDSEKVTLNDLWQEWDQQIKSFENLAQTEPFAKERLKEVISTYQKLKCTAPSESISLVDLPESFTSQQDKNSFLTEVGRISSNLFELNLVKKIIEHKHEKVAFFVGGSHVGGIGEFLGSIEVEYGQFCSPDPVPKEAFNLLNS